MNWTAALFAALAGVFTTIETNMNAKLGKLVTPGIATLHSLLVGAAFMLLAAAFSGNLRQYARIGTVSPLLLLGGVFGALIIYFSARAQPLLGVTTTLMLVLSGQLLSAFLIDLYTSPQAVSPAKLGGLLLFLVGAFVFIQS